LNECGYDLNSKKLCTVRLSRKIFPGFSSYGLGKLCRSLGIDIYERHRAGGDTEATVKVFQLLLQNDKEQHIQKSLLRSSKEQVCHRMCPKNILIVCLIHRVYTIFIMKKERLYM
jgi:DNA polymerase-3 subunit epsilon